MAVEHRRGVRNALEATGRRLGAGNGPLDGEGGSAATELAGACGFWPLEQSTVLRSSAKTTGR